jgi:hypothetical protein
VLGSSSSSLNSAGRTNVGVVSAFKVSFAGSRSASRELDPPDSSQPPARTSSARRTDLEGVHHRPSALKGATSRSAG